MGRANWDGFKAELETLPLLNITNAPTHILEVMWETLTNKIKLAAEKNIPITTYKIIPSFKTSQKIYYTSHNLYKHTLTLEQSEIFMNVE